MAEIKNTFSVGDYIIDFENIYQISEEKNQTDFGTATKLQKAGIGI